MNLIIKISLLICAFVLKANAQIYFNYNYEYNSAVANATAVIETNSGGGYLFPSCIYASGYGSFLINRIATNGDTLWTKEYKKNYYSFSTGMSNSIIHTFDDNYVFAGSVIDTGSNRDALLVKLNSNGDTLWTKKYGGTNFDNANIVCQTSDSGFVLMGVTQSYSMGPASDFYLIKTDSLGNFLWQQTYGTTLAEDCVSGQITLDGGFIMSGIKNSLLYAIKTDASGNFEWDRQIPGTAGTGFIKQLSDSSYILVGAKFVSGIAYQAYMAKLTKTGGVIWEKTFGGAGDQQFYAVPIILNDGSVVCSGTHTIGGIPWGLLIKTDSSGNQQWLRTFYKDPSKDNYFYDVKQTADNGFIMSGFGLVATSDPWLVKVDSNGCEITNCNVGVEEFQLSDSRLQIYPNPTSNEINISIEGKDLNDYEVAIINVLGEVQKAKIENSKISVSEYASGIYFITASSKDGKHRLSQKFVKQ